MQFVVIAHDGEQGRNGGRKAALPAHMENIARLREAGTLLVGAALIDGDKVIGSLVLLDVESRAEVDDFLKTEPLNTEGVWERVVVEECRVPSPYIERLRG